MWFRVSRTELEKCNGTRSSEETYVYRPFMDESIKEAECEVQKYNGKNLANYYLFNNNMDELIKIKATLGTPLNIREEEYSNTRSPLDVKYVSEEKRVIIE